MKEISFIEDKIKELKEHGRCCVTKIEQAMTLTHILSKEYYGFSMKYGVHSQGEYWEFLCLIEK